jgi:hypothetical protein
MRMAIAITTIILTIGTAIILTIVLFFFFLLLSLSVRVVSASCFSAPPFVRLSPLPSSLGLFPAFSRSRASCQGSR